MSEQMELLRLLLQCITFNDLSTVPLTQQHDVAELIEELQDKLRASST